MAKFSTGLRDYINANGALRQALANSRIQIWSGPIPETADSAVSGGNTLLCVVTDGNGTFNFATSSVGGVLTKQPDAVLTGNIIASGKATFFRHVLPSDVNAASTTAIRIQGTVGLAGTDMELNVVNLVSGGVQRLGSHSVALLEG